MKRLLLSTALVSLLAGPVLADELSSRDLLLFDREQAGVQLVDRATMSHGPIAPGRSQNLVIDHETGGQPPLATVIGFAGSSTVLYLVEQSTPHFVLVRAFNIGPFYQAGTVTVGFWE